MLTNRSTQVHFPFLFLLISLLMPLQTAQAGGWKWIAYGDTRTNDAAHRQVLGAIKRNTPDYSFMINVGDVTEAGSQGSLWNIWAAACNDSLGGTGQTSVPPKYMSAIGNHEEIGSTNGLTYWKSFLSGQYQQFGNDGKFFYFDYQDARFIVLNSEDPPSPTSAQQIMLLDAIQNNPRKWLFAIWHKPIFDFGAKVYESGIHQSWGVPLYQNGCDMIFMGHAHYYVRSKKLNLNGQMNPPLDPTRGTVQVVTGDGGAPHYAADENHDGNGYMVDYSYDLNQPAFYGYTELNVDGDTLRLRHFSASGQVMDSALYTPNLKPSLTPRFRLWTSVDGPGTIERMPADSTLYQGTTVVLHANPTLGSRFIGWTGALTGSGNPDSLVMTADTTVGAKFENLAVGQFELRTSASPGGTIELIPPGPYYAAGTIVTAIAHPAPGSVLSSWDGAASGDQDTVTVVLDTHKTLTATFHALMNYQLILRSIGQGTISVNPAGGVYAETTSVAVTATAAPGWEFVEWTGALNGMVNPATVQMKAAKEVKARFRKTGDVVWSLPATQDSYVRGSLYASNNYGTDSSLYVQEGTSDANRRRTCLQFDLTGVSGAVDNATLLLHTRANGLPDGVPARVVVCRSASDAWTEGLLTWRTMPAEGTTLDSTTGMTGTNSYYAWDVKALVDAELAGDKIASFLLKDRPGLNKTVIFDSRESNYSPILEIETSSTDAVGEEADLPREYRLEQNHPNPFNPTTGIRYQLSGISDVRLTVYDLLGREVAKLVNERKAAGIYQVTFKAIGLSSGVYYYRLQAVPVAAGSPFVRTRAMLLVR